MEYLMTYGWAILIIAVVLGVLFQLGIFSGSALTPKSQPGSCTVQRFAGQVSLEGLCQGQLPESVMQFYNNANSEHIVTVPISTTMNTAWSGGSWTINAWLYETNVITTDLSTDFVEEDTGCTSGLWISNESTTGYSSTAYSWYSGPTGACSSPVGALSVMSMKAPYDRWNMLTASFNYNPTGTGNYVQACINAVCSQTVWAESTSPTDFARYGYVFYMPDNNAGLLSGDMADVQLYNVSLSASEVNALYNGGVGAPPVRLQNIVGWWPLNGNFNDYSGNNDNGALLGSPQVAFNSTWNSQYTAP